MVPDWLVGLNLESRAGAQAAALPSGFGCCALSVSPNYDCVQVSVCYRYFDLVYLAVEYCSWSWHQSGDDYQYSMNQLMR